VAKAREHLVQRSFITRVGDGYVATVDERPALTYYANSVAHFFDA
jgi:glycerol-3-phosphate O-acyltransferase